PGRAVEEAVDHVSRDVAPRLCTVHQRRVDFRLPPLLRSQIALVLEDAEQRPQGARRQGDVGIGAESLTNLRDRGWPTIPDDLHKSELAVGENAGSGTGHASIGTG